MTDLSTDIQTFDLSDLARTQGSGAWPFQLAAWLMVGMMTVATLVLARDAVITQFGIAGSLIYLAGVCVILPMLWWALYTALYSLGEGPAKIEMGPTQIFFTRANGKLRQIPWDDSHLRIVIHDWRNRPDRLLSIVGEIRWMEQFALPPEALDALVCRSKEHNISITEGPYNDWWTGPENRIVISAGKK